MHFASTQANQAGTGSRVVYKLLGGLLRSVSSYYCQRVREHHLFILLRLSFSSPTIYPVFCQPCRAGDPGHLFLSPSSLSAVPLRTNTTTNVDVAALTSQLWATGTVSTSVPRLRTLSQARITYSLQNAFGEHPRYKRIEWSGSHWD